MRPPPAARASLELALDVVRWSLRFYWRHIGMVAGISLVASAQRAVGQLWGARLPEWSGMAGEAVTGIARVVLFVLILRLAILNDDRLRSLPGDEAWQRIVAFVRRAWRSLAVQVLLFAALFAVAELVPDHRAAGSRRCPAAVLGRAPRDQESDRHRIRHDLADRRGAAGAAAGRARWIAGRALIGASPLGK